MEVFGEEYELTPEEAKEVKEWADGVSKDNKDALLRDKEEFETGINYARAIDEIKGKETFDSGLKGRAESVAFYEAVHPLGGNKTMAEAARDAGIAGPSGYARLKTLKKNNPEKYDLDRWPSKSQLNAYRLVHPELGGCTQEQAAKILGVTQQAVQSRLDQMRQKYPDAFSFERVPAPKHYVYDSERDDDQIKWKF